MTVTLIVIVIMLALFLGWILSQSFNVRPWIAAAPTADTLDRLPPFFTPQRVGIAVFLGALSSLFALTISAYGGRLHLSDDWVSIPAPLLLWVNTGFLVLGSVFLHRGWRAATEGGARALKRGLSLGGAFTIAFVVGQFIVWQQLNAGGHYLTSNPAASFFYFITAMHAVHILGGLVAWAMTMRKVFGGTPIARVRNSMELCTVYWHYLLFIWAVMFGLVLFT